MSILYPGDAEDVLFINDGPVPHWWTSPDIWVGTPGGTVATSGANTVHVRVHLDPNTSFDPDPAAIDLFLGRPSIAMSPTFDTLLIDSPQPAALADFVGGAQERTFAMTIPVPAPDDPTGISAPGHKCLVARVYPFGTSTPNSFQVPTEQHEAQLNISIVSAVTGGQEGPGRAARAPR